MEGLRRRFPGRTGWALSLVCYAALMAAIVLCLNAPEAPFIYGEL